MDETAKILNQDEKILWEGRPQLLPYLVGAFFILIFGGFMIWMVSLPGTQINGNLTRPEIIAGIAVIFGGIFLYSLLAYKNIWYVITDKRVILQHGVVARDFDLVDFDKVESADVNVGVMDKIFGRNSGSILIYANRLKSRVVQTGSTSQTVTYDAPFVFSHITDPYGTFQIFKKVSFDVKADINYPNALRPKEDTGYNTTYAGEVPPRPPEPPQANN